MVALMGVTTTFDTVRAALEMAREYAKADEPAPTSGEARWAWKQALARFHHHMLVMLDTGEHQDPEQADLEGATREFCFTYCPHGIEEKPGEHLACAACPLNKYTLKRMARAAEDVASEARAERMKDHE
jgi:hypothetical protein